MSRAPFLAQVEEFGEVMGAVHAGQLRSFSLIHSVATGQPLPEGELRINVAVREDGTTLHWGLSGLSESEVFAYPEYGFEICAHFLPEIMRVLRKELDISLLKRSGGEPIVRRLLIEERETYPQATDAFAMLLRRNKRTLISFFPWHTDDGLAVSGQTAKEIAELADMVQQGMAEVHWFGVNALVLKQRAPLHSARQPSGGAQ